MWLKILFLLMGLSNISVMSVKSNGTVSPLNSLKWRSEIVSHSVVSDSWHPMDCSPPGSSVHGISQARILEWVAISFSRGSSWSRDRSQVSCIAGRFFTVWTTGEAYNCLPVHKRREGKSQPLHDSFNKIRLGFCILSYTICHTWRKGVFWRSQ